MEENMVIPAPRLIKEDEAHASTRLHRACFGSGAKPPHLRRPGEGEMWGISIGKTIAAQAAVYLTPLRVYDSLVQVGSLSGLCTHPEFRGRGLAGRLLEFCTHRLREQGAHLMLVPGVEGLFDRAGFTCFGRYAGFGIFGLGGYPFESQYEMRKITEADVPYLARLYHAEPVHFCRPLSRFATHFHARRRGQRAEEVIVEFLGRPVAYLMLDYDGEPEEGTRRLFEYAGSRRAISEAINLIQSMNANFGLRCLLPWQEHDLISEQYESQQVLNWDVHPEYGARILDFTGLMAALEPYLRGRLDSNDLSKMQFEQAGPLVGKDSTCTLVYEEDRLSLSTAAMTRLVLGDASDGDYDEDFLLDEDLIFCSAGGPEWDDEGEPASEQPVSLPEDAEEGEFFEDYELEEAREKLEGTPLADVLASIFPLPSFLPGLDGI